MPVEGFKHPRVWQYNFLPQPCSVLDRGWDRYDWHYEREVVERLRRGEAAPQSGKLTDLHDRNPNYGEPAGGWKQAEEFARNANRTNAVFLNDEAIALRLPDRERREAAHREYLAEVAVRMEAQRQRLEEEARERERLIKEEVRREKQRAKERASRDAEWRAWRAEAAPRTERQQILETRWQCGCGMITHIAYDSAKELFIIWCPRCDKTLYKEQQKLADRLFGRK